MRKPKESLQCRYFTALPVETALEVILNQGPPRFFGDGIWGEIHGRKIKIHYLPKHYRNSWNLIFVGNVYEHSTGAIIEGRFQTAQPVKVFMNILRGFMCLVLVVALISLITNDYDIMMIIFICFTPLTMLLFTFAFEKIGQALGADTEEEILKFIKKELQAVPLELQQD